ncbi:MAG: hypothetical protein ACTHJ3_07045, partial [Pararhizobium sp.]
IRVGDGMEYYGMFLAWVETHRPWMNAASFAAYERLHDAGTIIGTLPADYLKNAFPLLHLRDTADFNHFWFYSFLAAVVHFAGKAVGISLGAHESFLTLHALLFVLLLGVASYCYGWKGFLAALLLTVSSPIAWYANKVHTEFLTFCVTTTAIVLAMSGRLVGGAVFMAVASTQNPLLSLVPVAMLAVRGFGHWSERYSRWEVIGAIVTAVLLAMHPGYYMARYGVVTPQLLAGGAAPGAVMRLWYIWFIDPNVGLFPNWLFGLILLVLGTVCWRSSLGSNGSAEDRLFHPGQFGIICAVFFLACLFSDSSTENLNSGATPGIARYALWYIALFFPFALSCVIAASRSSRTRRTGFAAVALAFCIVAMDANITTVGESYVTPTKLSYFIQKNVPFLYNPPAEIFAERFSGYGESRRVKATVGPDCKKILILPDAPKDAPVAVPARCPFTPAQLSGWVDEEARIISAPTYKEIASNNVAAVAPGPSITVGRTYLATASSGDWDFSGWSQPEPTHRWSDGSESSLGFSLPAAAADNLCLVLKGATLGKQTITASIAGKAVVRKQLEGAGSISVPLGQGAGPRRVSLAFSNPHVPGNGDPRELAFALQSLIVSPCGGSE